MVGKELVLLSSHVWWLISAVAPANLIYSSASESCIWSGNGKEKVWEGQGTPTAGIWRPLPLILLFLVLILGNKNHLTHLLLVTCTGQNLPNQLSKARHWGCQHAPPSGFSCGDGDVPNLLFLPQSPSTQNLPPSSLLLVFSGVQTSACSAQKSSLSWDQSASPLEKGLSHGSGSWGCAGWCTVFPQALSFQLVCRFLHKMRHCTSDNVHGQGLPSCWSCWTLD